MTRGEAFTSIAASSFMAGMEISVANLHLVVSTKQKHYDLSNPDQSLLCNGLIFARVNYAPGSSATVLQSWEVRGVGITNNLYH